ncbi:hypothetical protein [Actinokineospora sp.]|uniref:hypothetical protein n=1 Tax=Actinokineospora sp. TaxID=1872133 RepID=UPI003D6AA042
MSTGKWVLLAVAVVAMAGHKPTGHPVTTTAPTRPALTKPATAEPTVDPDGPTRPNGLPWEYSYECDLKGHPFNVYPDTPVMRRAAIAGCELPPDWPADAKPPKPIGTR